MERERELGSFIMSLLLRALILKMTFLNAIILGIKDEDTEAKREDLTCPVVQSLTDVSSRAFLIRREGRPLLLPWAMDIRMSFLKKAAILR